MKRFFTAIISLLVCTLIQGQVDAPVAYPQVPLGETLNCMFYDSLMNVVYIGGQFTSIGGTARQNIAAIDASTGAVISTFSVSVNGPVNAIYKRSDTIYIGGNFNSVDGNLCNNFAAVDTSGSFYSLITHSFDNTVRSISAYGNKLYVAGEFTSANSLARDHIAEFNIQSAAITAWQPVYASGTPDIVLKCIRAGNLLVALYDLSGLVRIETLSSVSGLPVGLFQGNNNISDFDIVGNDLFISGEFNNIDVNGVNYLRDYLLRFDLISSAVSPVPYTVSYYPSAIGYYNDTLYLPNDLTSLNCDQILVHPVSGTPFTPTATTITNRFHFTGFCGSAGRMFCLYRSGSCATGSLQNQLQGFCVSPPAPVFISGSPLVCEGSLNNLFGVLPLEQYTSFTWSYTGTGVTINGSGPTVSLDFAMGATGGLLNVYASTNCVYNTPVASFTISMYTPVDADGGPDKNVTCDSSSVILSGVMNDPSLVFSWQLPGGSTQNTQQVFANTIGNYTLTATNTTTGCINFDTVYVGIDTVKPVINPFGSTDQLTCVQTEVILNGSTSNVSDSVWWVHQGGGVYANPDTVTLTGTYLFYAKKLVNGCTDTINLVVTSNTIPPSLSMPPMDSAFFAADIITCDTPLVYLNASSATPAAVFYWDNDNTPGNDSLANPIAVSYSGQFSCYVIDSVNGCMTSGIIFTQVDTSKPALTTPFDTTFITCSATSVLLDATSVTPSAQLTWTGPASFSSADPASANQAGWFYITAVKPGNGCARTDSVFIGVDSTLNIFCGNDTSVCPGTAASFSASVNGGTPPFIFQWSDGSANQSASFITADTTIFTVLVTDQNNCKGRDTVVVNVADAVNDSAYTFKPCDSGLPNGQITVYAYGGIPPYQFSIDSGQTFQQLSSFGNLNYGDYTITIRDTLGCLFTDTISINAQSFSLEADFLVASNSFEDSLLVLADICDAQPDSVWWEVPPSATLSGPDSTGTQYYLSIPDTGSFLVVMHALFGACEDADSAYVNLVQWDSTFASSLDGLIDSINVYPNPAPGGQFNLYVKLNKKQTFAIYLYNSSGSNPILLQNVYDADLFHNPMSVPVPSPGTYVIRVVAEYDSRYIILVVP